MVSMPDHPCFQDGRRAPHGFQIAAAQKKTRRHPVYWPHIARVHRSDQLYASGPGCNARPPCRLRVCHLNIPHLGGPMLAMLVTIGLEIVTMWSRSLPSTGV